MPESVENPSIDSEAGVPARSTDVNADVAFYRGLGFRVDEIFPADAPIRATLSGHGVRLFLEPEAAALPSLRIRSADFDIDERETPDRFRSPGGTRIDIVPLSKPVFYPPLVSELVVSRFDPSDEPHAGRAGMRYRDLIPGRQGDAVIASLISIPLAGPVNDWVHFHEVGFQLIFVKSGWVKVVYEDQGDPFVMRTGDCVIQPPTIRHRVLENSDGLEVVEVGYPAEHITKADPSMLLPNSATPQPRTWQGQSFIRHIDRDAVWADVGNGVLRTDTGISEATAGLADVDVLRAETDASSLGTAVRDGEFGLLVVLDGSVGVNIDGTDFSLATGESVVTPVGTTCAVHHHAGSRLLRVRIHTKR